MGRMNATWPLAVLEVREGMLSLCFRPKLVSTMAGTEPHCWESAALTAVYPARGRVVAFNRGVAIESTTAPLAYFWTLRPGPVLTALTALGMPVDWQERNIRLWR